MKINEKNLYTFANSKPVDKEGINITWTIDELIYFNHFLRFKAIYNLKEMLNFIKDGLRWKEIYYFISKKKAIKSL